MVHYTLPLLPVWIPLSLYRPARPSPIPGRCRSSILIPSLNRHLLYRSCFCGALYSCNLLPSALRLQCFDGFSSTMTSLPHPFSLILSFHPWDLIPLRVRRDHSYVRSRDWGCWLPVCVALSSTLSTQLFIMIWRMPEPTFLSSTDSRFRSCFFFRLHCCPRSRSRPLPRSCPHLQPRSRPSDLVLPSIQCACTDIGPCKPSC